MRTMRMRLVLILALVAVTPVATLSQETQAPKDAQAQALIALSHGSMGGANLLQIRDTRTELTVQSRDGESIVEQPATLKTLGRGKWRVEGQSPNGLAVFIVNGNQALSRVGSEEAEVFPALTAAEGGAWLIPLLSILGDWAGPEIKLEYLGIEEAGTIHHIRIHRTPEDKALAEVTKPCELFLDSKTLLPVKLSFSLHPPANLLVDIPAEAQYGDYRNVSGILIPFYVAYSINGQLVSEYRIKTFTVNNGFAESEFAVQ